MMATDRSARIRNTVAHLGRCLDARANGYPVSYTADPAWLVNMAINRRAGWEDDPSLTRGSCRPNSGNGRGFVTASGLVSRHAGGYPRKAEGDAQRHLIQLARKINSRAVVRESELGEWRGTLKRHMPVRFGEVE